MSWKDRWSHHERPKRPTRQKMTPDRRDALLQALERAIARTVVLPALGVRVAVERGFFFFERPLPDGEDWLEMARALPLAGTASLVLEAQTSRGAYFEVARGGVPAIVRKLAGGRKGTFHGLGPIEERAQATGLGLQREKLRKTRHGMQGRVADGAAENLASS